ncbi:DUF4188 domain-containing protein [Microlunatus soli]|uniref:DUF4188 domain-containing protein n=1 Tax=Microlunatus soli TaxID=630515 RepID=A0A1H1NNN0_9ACTN|nr:DUF4188 domain-containing protein [Microlunatus soli]SDR99919.1 protein of unknown function [Microlunatus soli]
MRRIRPGRLTHDHHGELVVFLIGVHVNKWWRPDRWLPVLIQMPLMLRELTDDPDSGLLGYRLVPDPRGPWYVQYWNSLDKLYGYADDPSARHRPAWQRFNRLVRSGGAVGAWHETYRVHSAESIYVDAPLQGLARATRIRRVGSGQDRAADRMNRRPTEPPDQDAAR